VAFWLFYAFGFVCATIISGLILFACREAGLLGLGWAIGGAGWLAWHFYSAVAVWMSARPKTKSPIWLDRLPAYGARLVVILFSGRLLVSLVSGGAIRWVNLVTGSMDLNP
jgi:hypothetical protein